MENSNDINNTTIENNNTVEPEVKKKISQALKDGQKDIIIKLNLPPNFKNLEELIVKNTMKKIRQRSLKGFNATKQNNRI